MIIEKLASKRRTGSDNLITKTNKKPSNYQKKSKIPSTINSPKAPFITPDKTTPFQSQSNIGSQTKIQSMSFSRLPGQKGLNNPQITFKTTKTKGMKTIDNPEMLGVHRVTLSKVSNSENFSKKIVFTEPDMDCSEDHNINFHKKYSKFSNISSNKHKMKLDMSNYEKNRSMTNFIKPNYSTGITSNSRPTKPTEEDFDSEEISEGKNCEYSSQDLKNLRENYLAEGGFDYELIEKMNELSEGVKYTFGGVGVSKEEKEGEYNIEEDEDEEKKESDNERIVVNKTNINNMKELKYVKFEKNHKNLFF